MVRSCVMMMISYLINDIISLIVDAFGVFPATISVAPSECYFPYSKPRSNQRAKKNLLSPRSPSYDFYSTPRQYLAFATSHGTLRRLYSSEETSILWYCLMHFSFTHPRCGPFTRARVSEYTSRFGGVVSTIHRFIYFFHPS